jgi:hypothetical protein
MHLTMYLLAAEAEPAAGASFQQLLDILPWLALFLGAIISGSFLMMWARRSLRHGPPPAASDSGSSLSTFRDLRERGEISAEEYAAIRDRLARRVKEDL